MTTICTLIIDDSPIQETGNQDLRPGIWVSFLPLSSGSFQLRHHRIVTYGKQKYSFVPHFHAILHFWCFWTFVLSWVPLPAFFMKFLIQAPLSIVSFCVRDVLIFQLTDGEELWQSCTHMVQYLLWYIFLFWGDFDSYFPFWLSIHGMELFKYNILFTLLPFHGLLLSPPRTFFSVRWMEPRNSILDLFILSYFTRIKQDFNVSIAI